MINNLKSKITDKSANIGIIGLGYVGLPLAVEFAKAGFSVTGFDNDSVKVSEINKGASYIPDVPSKDVKDIVSSGKLSVTSDKSLLNKMDVIIICVPTPLRKTKEPDISFILQAAEDINSNLRKGQLVILESTTYPGTTEEVILPKLGGNGLKVGKDIFIAFSPERVDPGNKKYKTKDIPKVVGGVTEVCTELAKVLYSQIIKEVIPVSSTRSAEMVKLLENTYRIVNIGLINEIALLCNKMDVDVWEIINAAKTKPFGFMPFYPGPGVGGHCISTDPHYLSWKARTYGFETRFIELAEKINSSMPHYVVDRIIDGLNSQKKPLKGSKILIVGVTYKKDISDMRESPSLAVINSLIEKEAKVQYHDPLVSNFEIDGLSLNSIDLTKESVSSSDCVVIITDHTVLDYKLIAENANLVLDTRNALKAFKGNAKIIKL
ncbi:MAG: nucleotide sugar dehydrogenase [Candidatus Omnitrophica bacterium]|nr:nucleotide sugar dehydrogenase [Candidatus Omnitrophota bacterium]MBU4457639.1 nucleotide sugar dehydrogenase [Candidatus Omnitrophota bacterium]